MFLQLRSLPLATARMWYVPLVGSDCVGVLASGCQFDEPHLPMIMKYSSMSTEQS